MRSPVQILVALAILLATATVAAQVFKWIDKDGKVHFTDTPPPADAVKGEAKKVMIAPSGGPAASNTKAAAKDAGKDGGKGAAKGAEKGADKAKTEAVKAKKEEENERIAKQNEERCREAKRYMSSLESGAPIFRNNDAGERNLMSDAERSSEMTRAKTAISESCKT